MYIFKNIGLFIKNHTVIFAVLMMALLISFVVMLFSVGVFYRFNKNIEDAEADTYAIGSSINGEISRSEFDQFLSQLPDDLKKDVSFITSFSSFVSADDRDETVCFYMEYDSSGFSYSKKIFDMMLDDLVLEKGRFFTEDEYRSGDTKAVVLGQGVFDDDPVPVKDGKVSAFGKEYDVIGVLDPNIGKYDLKRIYIPFSSLPDDARMIDSFYFSLNKKITRSEYDRFSSYISDNLGDRVIQDPLVMNLRSDIHYYVMLIISTFLTALVSALNVAVIYNYIVLSRRRQMYVFKLCGAVPSKISRNIAGEIAVMMIPVSVIAALGYKYLLLPVLAKIFEGMENAYTLPLMIVILLIYNAVTYLINYIVFYRITKAELKAGDERCTQS